MSLELKPILNTNVSGVSTGAVSGEEKALGIKPANPLEKAAFTLAVYLSAGVQDAAVLSNYTKGQDISVLLEAAQKSKLTTYELYKAILHAQKGVPLAEAIVFQRFAKDMRAQGKVVTFEQMKKMLQQDLSESIADTAAGELKQVVSPEQLYIKNYLSFTSSSELLLNFKNDTNLVHKAMLTADSEVNEKLKENAKKFQKEFDDRVQRVNNDVQIAHKVDTKIGLLKKHNAVSTAAVHEVRWESYQEKKRKELLQASAGSQGISFNC